MNHRSSTNDAPERVSSKIQRELGRGPQGPPPHIPEVEPRLRIDDDGNIVDHPDDELDDFVDDDQTSRGAETRVLPFIEKVVARLLNRFRSEIADLGDLARDLSPARQVPCETCSHDGCNHFHEPDDMNSQDVSDYLGVKLSTIYAWLHRQRITRPLSETPHLWDSHVIACHKHDQKLVFSTAQYNPAEHRQLLKKARAENERKRKATSAKRSAHMVRENARRRAEKAAPQRPKLATNSTHTRTSRTRKR